MYNSFLEKYAALSPESLEKASKIVGIISGSALALGGLATLSVPIVMSVRNKMRVNKTWDKIVQSEELKQIPIERKAEAFSVLKEISPRMASMYPVAANFIRKYETYGIIDPAELKLLAQTEESLKRGIMPGGGGAVMGSIKSIGEGSERVISSVGRGAGLGSGRGGGLGSGRGGGLGRGMMMGP